MEKRDGGRRGKRTERTEGGEERGRRGTDGGQRQKKNDPLVSQLVWTNGGDVNIRR
jgi:hypothetical protein